MTEEKDAINVNKDSKLLHTIKILNIIIVVFVWLFLLEHGIYITRHVMLITEENNSKVSSTDIIPRGYQ